MINPLRKEQRKMKTINSLLILLVLLVISGCTGTHGPFNRYVRYENRNYGSWHKSDRITRNNGEIEISNLSVMVVGTHKARITGTISCWYTETGYEERAFERYYIYTNRTESQGWKVETRKIHPRKREHHPKVINLCNPYGHGIQMEISPEGKFSGCFELDSKYYFKNLPPRKPYYGRYHKANPKKLRLSVDRPKDYPNFGKHYEPLPKFNFILREDDKAKDYAKNMLCRVSLLFKEQVTRREVSPRVTITPLNVPSYKDRVSKFKSRLEREFAGDEELVSLGMKSGKHYLDDPLSETKTDASQAISFQASVGSKYKIETVHGEFNYFRGFITPSSSEPIDKIVLLVEKGEKIRMQEVREGEGGSMVDSN